MIGPIDLDDIKKKFRTARGKYDVVVLSELAVALQHADDDESVAWQVYVSATLLFLQGDMPHAFQEFTASLERFEQLDQKLEIAAVRSELGIVYWQLGDYAKALEMMHHSLMLQEEIGNTSGIGGVIGNIGMLYGQTDDYTTALSYYRRALDIQIQTGHKVFQAITTGNIGVVYSGMGDLESALQYHSQALEIQQELENANGVAVALINKAGIYLSMKNYEEAISHIQRGIDKAVESADNRLIAQGIATKARIASEQGRWDECVALLDEHQGVIQLFPSIHTTTLFQRADVFRGRGEAQAARDLILTALEQSTQRNERAHMADCYLNLRDLSKDLADFDAYIRYNELYMELTNEIRGQEKMRKIAMQEKEREFERERAILYSALPKHVAERLVKGEIVNDHIDTAAVMFVDIVGFTTLSSSLTSQQVVTLLDTVFGICDEACNKNDVTRVKTIGDSYMAVGFPPLVPRDDSAFSCSVHVAQAAVTILERLKNEMSECLPDGGGISVRIGLHVGPVTAGVLGNERLQYDIWGDTVNVASRMESTGEPNRIHVSLEFKGALENVIPTKEGENVIPTKEGTDLEPGTWNVEPRGTLELKGKGMMQTFWLERA